MTLAPPTETAALREALADDDFETPEQWWERKACETAAERDAAAAQAAHAEGELAKRDARIAVLEEAFFYLREAKDRAVLSDMGSFHRAEAAKAATETAQARIAELEAIVKSVANGYQPHRRCFEWTTIPIRGSVLAEAHRLSADMIAREHRTTLTTGGEHAEP